MPTRLTPPVTALGEEVRLRSRTTFFSDIVQRAAVILDLLSVRIHQALRIYHLWGLCNEVLVGLGYCVY